MNDKIPFKIKPGVYDVYNESHIEVLMSVRDKASGDEFVLCKKWSCVRTSDYFLVPKDEFLSEVTDNRGKIRRKYRFEPFWEETDRHLDEIVEDGFGFVQDRIDRRQSKRDVRNEKYLRKRTPRSFDSYYDYAKDLLENRIADIARIKLCQQRKEYVGISKKLFIAMREDQHFVALCFEDTLAPFVDLFKELYGPNGLTVRGYAEKHGINRGSVEHRKRKMFITLANELERRDNADGVSRLNQYKIDVVAGLTAFAKSVNKELTLEQKLSLLMFQILDEGTEPKVVRTEIVENDYAAKVKDSGSELIKQAFDLLDYYASGDDDVSISDWHEVMRELDKQ